MFFLNQSCDHLYRSFNIAQCKFQVALTIEEESFDSILGEDYHSHVLLLQQQQQQQQHGAQYDVGLSFISVFNLCAVH
jgi:hypothetical protein